MEDVNKCVQALQDRDPETVDRTAGQIRGRTARLEDVVSAEMENYQPGPYTDNVMSAVLVMRNESKFCSFVPGLSHTHRVTRSITNLPPSIPGCK